jgi:hypothetical protein
MSGYPTLNRSTCTELTHLLLGGAKLPPGIDSRIDWLGAGHDVDLSPISDAVLNMSAEFEKVSNKAEKDPDWFEGRAAGLLHESFKAFPVEMLDDPGFWRYLSIMHFWWFVSWREPPAKRKQEKYEKYVDGTSPSECVLLRMFIRAQAIVGADGYGLGEAIPKGTDFWRSHVLRVRTSSAPPVARSFASMQSTLRMPTADLRVFARRLNRAWTNIVLHAYDEAEASALLSEIRASMDGDDQDSESVT